MLIQNDFFYQNKKILKNYGINHIYILKNEVVYISVVLG